MLNFCKYFSQHDVFVYRAPLQKNIYFANYVPIHLPNNSALLNLQKLGGIYIFWERRRKTYFMGDIHT